MKTMGLIGGMSWESTVQYYQIINRTVNQRLGGFHSAKCVLYSVDFAEVELLQHQGKWEDATRLMIEAARGVERAGAEFLVICTNTMHKMADDVQRQIGIPILHIADATAKAILAQELKKVGLLGTRFTMEEDFYRGRLSARHGLDVLIPTADQREAVHRIIFDELCAGIIKPPSEKIYLEIIEDLAKKGAQAVILGCTEIGLLVKQEHCRIPLFDTTVVHAEAAVDYALKP
jgi:aspartate racemase